eukprot:7610262-Pyramimonas_sp.AAC.1
MVMVTALTQDNGACVLLDFKAAFPSIAQEFLFETLDFIGLPPSALHTVRHLYNNASCRIA